VPPEKAKIMLIAIRIAKNDHIHLIAVFVFLLKRKLIESATIVPHV